MSGFTFDLEKGMADAVFGKCQNPIKYFIEQRGEEFEKNSLLKSLFHMATIDNYGAEIHTMGSMSGFEPGVANSAYPAASLEESFSKFIKMVEWKNSFSLSASAMEDGVMMDLTDKPAHFMTSYERTREKFGAKIFAGAMAGKKSIQYGKMHFDITGADGRPLFCKEHPSKFNDSKQCNVFSDEFSVEALDAVESEMHLFKDDNGEILDVAPDTILIPEDPVLKRQVFAVIGADKDPVTSNNGFNYQYGRWNITVWPYLNQFLEKGLKPWMLIDSAFNQKYKGAVWLDRIKLAVKSTIDDNTDANVWRGRSRYNAGINDWRFAALGGFAGGEALV